MAEGTYASCTLPSEHQDFLSHDSVPISSASRSQSVNNLGLTLSPGSYQQQQLEQPETYVTDHWLDDIFDGQEFHAAVNGFDLSSELDLDGLFGVTGYNDAQEQLPSRKRPRKESPTPGNNDLLFETKRAKSSETESGTESRPPGSTDTTNLEDRDTVAKTLEACISENAPSPNSLFDEPQSLTTADSPFQAEETAKGQDTSKDIGIEKEKPPVRNPEENTAKTCSCLNGDNLAASDLLMSLQQVREQELYSSPYLCNNSVEYFPSSPSTHNKCKLRLDMMNLENMRRAILIEYTNHKRAREEWMTPDPLTGKTRRQLTEEENEQLKCQASQLEEQVSWLKKQAANLKRDLTNKGNKYRSLKQEYDKLTGVYNSLVEIHNNCYKREQGLLPQLVWLMPNTSPGTVPYLTPATPHGPPSMMGSMPTQKSTGSNRPAEPTRLVSTASPQATGAVPHLATVAPHGSPSAVRSTPTQKTASSNHPAVPTGLAFTAPPHAISCPPSEIPSSPHTTMGTVSIPIDLTMDENQDESRSRNEPATSDPLPSTDGSKLLQNLRKKAYKWLPDSNHLGNLRRPHGNSDFSGEDSNRSRQSNSAPKDPPAPGTIDVTGDAQVMASTSASETLEGTGEADIGDFEKLVEVFERELANGA